MSAAGGAKPSRGPKGAALRESGKADAPVGDSGSAQAREPGTPLVLVAAPTRGGREAKPRTECDAQPSH